MDGQVDGWTVGHDGGNGQVRRVGGGRTGTRCPSMNVARGRRLKNARSTEIWRSVCSGLREIESNINFMV